MQVERGSGEDECGGNGAPGAGAGFAEAGSEEGCDSPHPDGDARLVQLGHGAHGAFGPAAFGCGLLCGLEARGHGLRFGGAFGFAVGLTFHVRFRATLVSGGFLNLLIDLGRAPGS